jgi:hypothetical protein
MFKSKRLSRKNILGQALVEYALAILMVMGVFFVIDFQIKRSIKKIWIVIAKNVAPGCPGCEAPEEIR